MHLCEINQQMIEPFRRRNDQHSPCSSSTGALGRFYRRIYLRGPLHVQTNDVDQIKFRNYDEIFDEVDQLQYSWCVFHLVLCGAALFVMLTLTNLYYPKRSTKVRLDKTLCPNHNVIYLRRQRPRYSEADYRELIVNFLFPGKLV